MRHNICASRAVEIRRPTKANPSILVALLAVGWSVPSVAQDIVPPKVLSTTPYGLNIADGSYQSSVTDLAIGDLKLERFTLTRLNQPGNPVNDAYFGVGFSHNFDIYVAPNLTAASGQPWNNPTEYHPIVHIGNSASGVYVQSSITGNSIALNAEARKGTLEKVSNAYVYTDQQGIVYTFNTSVKAGGSSGQYSQRVATIAHPDGRLETFSYDAAGKLKLIQDNAGYGIVFDYNASGDVSVACGFNLAETYVTATSSCSGAPLNVSYGYTSSLLTSVTNALGQTTTYGRSSDTYGHIVTCITPAGTATCQVSNTVNVDGKIWSQTTGGANWSITNNAEEANNPEAPIYGCGNAASLTDPSGKVTNFIFSGSSPCSMTDPLNRTTTFEWDGSVLEQPRYDQTANGSFLISATYPEGNKYLAEYLGPYKSISKETLKAKPGSGAADLVKQYLYGSCSVAPSTRQNCTKPIAIIDPKGSQTDFTYASHGGVLTEMAPAPAAGQYRPLKVTAWTQRYAWVKNSAGTLVQAASPIWVKASETQCQTAAGTNPAAVCDGAAQQTVTIYEYGATGTGEALLVKGVAVSSGGVTLRTCAKYDTWHRKISETKPNANLASCS